MQDDTTNQDEVLEQEVVADEPQTTPEAEEQQQEQVETESTEEAQEEASTEEGQTEDTEERPPSRREQLRIQQLLNKYGDPRQKQQQQQAPSQQNDRLDYSTALDADPEVIQQLEADRRATSDHSYQEGLKRAEFYEWKTSLKIDAPVIERKYPILDKNSPEFHPAVADAMNTWYLRMSGYDPHTETVRSADMSYADFVEANMELVEEIAGQKNAQTVKNVTKQAAQTSLRPDGSSAPRLNLNKAPQEMTMDELYASIGQKNPHKK